MEFRSGVDDRLTEMEIALSAGRHRAELFLPHFVIQLRWNGEALGKM